jgi:hypothetical protein
MTKQDHALRIQVENLVQGSRFHGVMVSTLDSESSDPSTNLGGTLTFFSTKSPILVAIKNFTNLWKCLAPWLSWLKRLSRKQEIMS